jgi:glutamate racemase
VLGTEATVASHAYRSALQRLNIESREKACPLLVPLIEEGWGDHKVTEEVIRIYLGEALSDGFQGADVLLLGCTHYPLIKPLLQRIVPGGVKLVDSAESVAKVVRELIQPGTAASGVKFFVTDSTEKFRRLGKLFLGQEIHAIEHVDLKE